MAHAAPLITTLAAAFAGAWVLGLLARRLGLAPIVGYLLAGVAIGPYTPGFVGDTDLAAQLAEIGVVLLMFGVGIHFHPKDLLAVKRVAIPGALLQSAVATVLGDVVGRAFGWSTASGLVFGLSLAVASTVVLMRVLEDGNLLDTAPGHVAVGWLIVEDLLTVVVLVMLPVLAGLGGVGPSGLSSWLTPLAVAMGKLAVLVALVMAAGSRLVPRLLEWAAGLRSRELFTLTVLALALVIATGAAFFFGVSMALGAFLAGMVVGQSPLSHQAAADALPMRDAFAVLFFVSVGMLFDPALVLRQPWLVLAALGVVLVGKPLAAVVVVSVLGYSARTALTVGLGLAQIGEFSFILAQLGRAQGVLPAEAPQVLVACALVSISINPLLMQWLDRIEGWLRSRPALWRIVEGRAERRRAAVNAGTAEALASSTDPRAVIVGYGPVGQAVERLVRQAGLDTVVVDMNPDTVRALTDQGRRALFGDASLPDILKQAGVDRASHLIVTLPHSLNRVPLIMAARELNPALRILVRARYLRERRELEQAGASAARFEEAEAAVALADLVLGDLGRDEETIRHETARIRDALQ
jgi:CPA2 family monovalent cation:H+ antiporter-2